MYIFLTILNRYSHRFNYPFDITEQNAEAQYHLAKLMVQALKAEVIWIFFYIEWISIKDAMGKGMGLGMGLSNYLIIISIWHDRCLHLSSISGQIVAIEYYCPQL